MRLLLQLLLPLLFLGGLGYGAWTLYDTKQEVETAIPPRVLPKVKTLLVQPSTVQLRPTSQGIVRPRRSTTLSAEVSGLVVETSPRFLQGETFRKGETLVRIDDLAPRTQLAEAKARLAAARLVLATEEAEANAASRDLARLQRAGRSPSDLFLRRPQIAKAQADITAAEANITLAERNIARTTIVAPFNGKIRRPHVEIGQAVTAMATPIADIMSTEALEIVLPLTASDAAQIDLASRPTVILQDGNQQWTATLDRSTGQIDAATRRLQLVATITGDAARNLQLGQFLTAEIDGNVHPGVYEVPRSAMRSENTLHIITPENRLQSQEVTVIHQSPETVVISAGLSPGNRISLTRVPAFVEGMQVEPLP